MFEGGGIAGEERAEEWSSNHLSLSMISFEWRSELRSENAGTGFRPAAAVRRKLATAGDEGGLRVLSGERSVRIENVQL